MRADVGDRVFFGAASSEIGSRARAVLERQAQWLARYRELYVVIEGHADDPGDESTNESMALQRAEAARKRLLAAGVSSERVDLDVRGRRDRAVVCEEATCRSQNRRVVMRLMIVLPSVSDVRPDARETELPARIAHDTDSRHEHGITPAQR